MTLLAVLLATLPVHAARAQDASSPTAVTAVQRSTAPASSPEATSPAGLPGMPEKAPAREPAPSAAPAMPPSVPATTTPPPAAAVASTAAATAPATPSLSTSTATPPPKPAAEAFAKPPPPPPPPPHPLNPLNASEIAAAVKLLKEDNHFPEDGLFPFIALEEPSKKDLERYGVDGSTPARKALAVLLERARSRTYEAVVNLTKRKVERIGPKAGVHAGFLVEELTSAPEIARKDPGWRAAMRRRGVTDFSAVHLDGWAPGTIGITGASGPRLVRVIAFYKGKSSNFYARPVEGLVAVVDMAQRKVVRLDDTGEIPLSQLDGAFDEKAAADPRLKPKPLEIRQPAGPSYERRGWEVQWLNWSFRFSLHPREGPVLHDVATIDGGKRRKVLHRASLSEMVVPYGDPAPSWAWRSAFDVGEYGVGRLASPLELGTDVPANAELLDADFVDDFGKAYALKNSLALYERDGGLLWKHYTLDPETNESRRGRELVLASIATVGNYDYALKWVFGLDGSLTFETELTGIMLAKGVEEDAHDPYSHRVSTRVAAPHHQHFFNLRLDLDVDGTDNALFETAVVPLPDGAGNPDGNAFTMEVRALKSEAKARRSLELRENRKWLVASEESKKEGHPAGFLLVPGENSVPYARPGSTVRKRAGFLDYHVWATRFDPEERYAAGDYPNQAAGGEGLPRFSENDESLDGKDVVLWYTFGITHTPRPEEWPIMSAHRASARLIPVGFFRQNPALGVPR